MIFIDFSDGGLVKYENLRNRVKRRILGKNNIRKVVVTYGTPLIYDIKNVQAQLLPQCRPIDQRNE